MIKKTMLLGLMMILFCSFATANFFGDGSDGSLVFTTTTKTYGNLTNNTDYNASGNTLYLNLNQDYQFVSFTLGDGTNLSTQDDTGAVLYIRAQDFMIINGSINLANVLTLGDRADTFTGDDQSIDAPGVAPGGSGGTAGYMTGRGSPGSGGSQGSGYGGAGGGGANNNFAPTGSGGDGSDGGSTAGSGGGAVTGSTKGVDGSDYSAGGSGSSNIGFAGSCTSGTGANAYGAHGGAGSGTDYSGCGGGGGSGNISGISGIHLYLKSYNIDFVGSINLSGTDGSDGGSGGNADATSGVGHGFVMAGGGGGAGGSGGGNSGSLNVFSPNYVNSGSLTLLGGSGGSGGSGGRGEYCNGVACDYSTGGNLNGTDGSAGSAGSAGSEIVSTDSILIYPQDKKTYFGDYNNSVIVATIDSSQCYLNRSAWAFQGSQRSTLFHWLNPSFTPGNLSMQYSCAPQGIYDPNIVNDIVSNNTGTLSGYTLNHASNHSTTYNATGGYFGGAYEFEVSHLDTTFNPNFNTSGCIAIWTKINSITSPTWSRIVNRGATNPGLQTNGNDLRVYFSNGQYGECSNIFVPNQWNHIMACTDGSTTTVYNNGTICYGPTARTVDDNRGNFVLGYEVGGARAYFNGTIDELRIWVNDTLTQTEAQAEMNSANPVHTEGLVASYSFEEWGKNSTHAFDTNPTVQGHNEDNLSQAMRFDGVDDYVGLGSDGFEETICNNGCTISGWYNVNSFSSEGTGFARWDSSNDNLFYRLRFHTSKLVYAQISKNGSSSSAIQTTGGSALNTNQWYNVVYIYNGSTTKEGSVSLYIDGLKYSESAGTVSIDATRWLDDEHMFFGVYDDGSHNLPFNGSIDDVMIWDRALIDSEILELYNNNSWKYAPYDSLSEDAVAGYDFQANNVLGDWAPIDFWFVVKTLFRINIFDELTNNMILDPISFIFRSETFEFKASATGGSYDLYNISEIPPGFYQIILNGTDYFPRTYHLTIENTSFQTTNFYLLDSNQSDYVVFYFKNLADQALQDISVVFTTWINVTSSDAPITHKFTDVAGGMLVNLFWLSRYGLTITDPSGLYDTKYAEIEPIFDTYTIYLDNNESQNFTTVWDHVSYRIGIQNTTLNPIETNFSFMTVSDSSNILYYGITALINGTTYVTNISTHPSGGTAYLTLPLNTSNDQNINVSYFIHTSNPHFVWLESTYSILNISSWIGNYSIAKTAPQYRAQFSERFRLLLAVFVAVIVVAMFAVFVRRNYAPLVGIPVLILFAIPPISWIPVWIVAFLTIIIGGFFLAFGEW